jgi:hypothetical protein
VKLRRTRAAWGEANISFPRRYLPYEHGVPGGRWLTLLTNRVDPALFSVAFTAWVRETWPDRPGFIAMDGKTSRRSHDRAEDRAPLHLAPPSTLQPVNPDSRPCRQTSRSEANSRGGAPS